MLQAICLLFIFDDQFFIDPTFFGIFACGPLQSFMVNVYILIFYEIIFLCEDGKECVR